MTYQIDELQSPILNVHKLRTSKAGRQILRDQGRWSEDDVEKWKHRNKGDVNAQHRRMSKPQRGPFLAWDGEGMDINGSHTYTLLMNDTGAFIESPTGLTTRECLDFLCDEGAKHSKANHVIYGGTYDANMILADLPLFEIRGLIERKKVTIMNGLFTVEYLPRKYLKVTRWGDAWDRKKRRPVVNGSIRLWDTIGFFQSSFVTAVSKWLNDPNGIRFVEQMKANRSRFQVQDAETIRKYCLTECQMLSKLMTELRDQFKVIGYVPDRWDGSGAIASKTLSIHKVKNYGMDVDHENAIASKNPNIVQAAQYGYYGGRIECVRTGNYEQPVYAHDIVSAYPFAMSTLPCLAHTVWTLRNTPPNDLPWFSIWFVKYRSRRPQRRLHPLPVRYQDRVLFPQISRGWYWQSEVKNLVKHYPGEFEIVKGWVPTFGCNHRPFAFVNELFDKRRALKASQHPAEKAIKLQLNSLYGKLVQQVGWRMVNGEIKRPPYHQLAWAGWITSVTRARMLDLAMTDEEAVISFETDGLYSTIPHCPEDVSGNLGSIEQHIYDGITYVQSGVYWVKENNEWHAKYRGMDYGTLTRDAVLEGWAQRRQHITATETRFHGMFTASLTPETFDAEWRQWITRTKEISLQPQGKRIHSAHCWCRTGEMREGLHETAALMAGDGVSEPYDLSWQRSKWDAERLGLAEAFPDE